MALVSGQRNGQPDELQHFAGHHGLGSEVSCFTLVAAVAPTIVPVMIPTLPHSNARLKLASVTRACLLPPRLDPNTPIAKPTTTPIRPARKPFVIAALIAAFCTKQSTRNDSEETTHECARHTATTRPHKRSGEQFPSRGFAHVAA